MHPRWATTSPVRRQPLAGPLGGAQQSDALQLTVWTSWKRSRGTLRGDVPASGQRLGTRALPTDTCPPLASLREVEQRVVSNALALSGNILGRRWHLDLAASGSALACVLAWRSDLDRWCGAHEAVETGRCCGRGSTESPMCLHLLSVGSERGEQTTWSVASFQADPMGAR